MIVLDLELPRMDGITFLHKIMSEDPVPVVICSSLAEKGTELSLRALEEGAVSIVTKPKLGVKNFLHESAVILIDEVLGAAHAHLRRRRAVVPAIEPKRSADAVLPLGKQPGIRHTTGKVAVIGASTGGTEAIREILEALPPDAPGIVVVQHMPELFTAAFADRLNQDCAMEVKEAANGDRVLEGRALIAPGNRHTLLRRSGAHYIVEVSDGPLVNRHRPSVDVLFRSAAQAAGPSAVGVILTGMGDDGAEGLLEMKRAGSTTLAQDEATCVVFGMPKEAIERGAVDHIVSLPQVAAVILGKVASLSRLQKTFA